MRIERWVVFILLLVLISGCAINNKTFGTRNEAFSEAENLFLNGELELGLLKLEQAAQEEPENKEIRTVLMRQRDEIPQQMVFQANNIRFSGDLETAEKMYNRILEIFPRYKRAQLGLEALELERHHIALIDYAQELVALNDIAGAEKTVRAVLQENPEQSHARQLIKQISTLIARTETTGLTLETAFKKPFTIEFRDTDLKTVFELMAKTAGINFVFDKDVRQETKISLFVRDNSVEDILNLILMTNQLAYKELNQNSLLIYPKTPAKQKEYQELVVRSFHIAYTDVKQMVAMVRGLVKARDIYVNEQLNLFIIRDTLEAIRVVERLVALNDYPEPEVMLDVVIMTVTRDNNFLLGPNLPTSAAFSAVPGGELIEPLSEFGFDGLKSFSMRTTAAIDFSHSISNADILANPRIRVKNREAAKIHIGDREPIFTANVTGVTAVVTVTPTYLDLGIKLDVEPIIGLNNDVTMKVSLEVSATNGFVDAPGDAGGSVPRIRTSNAETLLTLKDGETQVLGGLIENNETKTIGGIAGLVNILGLDRLTSSQKIDRSKRELILLITPRVLRNITQPSNLESEFHFGTDNNVGHVPVTISNTAAGSLAMASAGSGGRGGASAMRRGSNPLSPPNGQATPNPFAQAVAAEPTVTMQAPANVGLDKEFSMRVRMVGARASVTSEARLSYATDMLELLGVDDSSGTHTIKFGQNEPSGMSAQLRFKVISANPGPTEISIQSVEAEDPESGESIDVKLPEPSTINIQ
jgi:general secretion pathway protein D